MRLLLLALAIGVAAAGAVAPARFIRAFRRTAVIRRMFARVALHPRFLARLR